MKEIERERERERGGEELEILQSIESRQTNDR